MQLYFYLTPSFKMHLVENVIVIVFRSCPPYTVTIFVLSHTYDLDYHGETLHNTHKSVNVVLMTTSSSSELLIQSDKFEPMAIVEQVVMLKPLLVNVSSVYDYFINITRCQIIVGAKHYLQYHNL